MLYQLVLQWPVASLFDYDAMIQLEDILIRELPDDTSLDGHDAGSGEFNIFIITRNPKNVFKSLNAIVEKQKMSSGLRAGYRSLETQRYAALWPVTLSSFEVK